MSGGSGTTPVMSMIRTLRDTDHTGRVTFLHYARSREDEMFTDELDELAAQLPQAQVVRIYTRKPEPKAPSSRAASRSTTSSTSASTRRRRSRTYAARPASSPASATRTKSSAPTDQLRMEYFKVPSVDLDAADATGTLTFDNATIVADNSGATILEQAEAAGLKPEFGCRMGVCNTCVVKKNHGAVRHVISKEISANTDETIKICVHVPVGDVNVAL